MPHLHLRLFISLLLAGCLGCTTVQPLPNVGRCMPRGQPEGFDTVIKTSGSTSGSPAQRFEIIHEQERLAEVWQEIFAPNAPPQPPPSIDFQVEMILLYSMGTQPNLCYSTKIQEVYVGGEVLFVEVEETEPARLARVFSR